MIVICTGCQARFRVADEKIGPRGAKVRCTRCQSVFVVKRDAGEAPPPPPPKFDLDLTPGLARPAPVQDPFAAPAGASVIPFPPSASAPARAQGPAADPFAAAGLDVFESGEGAGDDPFARAAAGFEAQVAVQSAPPAPAAFAPDPFAAPPQEPFAAGPTTGSQRLPVTDLAQLLGAAPAAPAAAPPPPPPPAPYRAGPEDLALEEHSGSMQGPIPAAPAPFADPSDVLPADAGLFATPGAEFEPGAAFPGEESLALATDPTPGPAPALVPPPAPPAGDGPAGFSPVEEAWAAQPPGAPAAPAGEPPAPSPAPAGQARRPAAAPGHRVRSAALNALALVALLILALAIRVVLRGDVPLGPEALRPSTLLRSLGGAAPATGPFELADVRSGVYPQGAGGAVLFVRGVVVCRPPAPVDGVKVEAELVRDGQVLSRGEVIAGALPSPEEVYRATDRAGLDALAAELRKRAPEKVSPGDRLSFLVTLGDAPADLSGTRVRLQATGAAR